MIWPFRSKTENAAPRIEPRMQLSGTTFDLNDPRLKELLRGDTTVGSAEFALRIGVAWRSLHILCGAMSSAGFDLMRRLDERRRVAAVGHSLRRIFDRPNPWQSWSGFVSLLQACKILRGNAYALKVYLAGEIVALIPLHPDRVVAKLRDDLKMEYVFTRPNGSRITYQQKDIFHLRGLSLDGVTGIGVLAYARNAMALSVDAEKTGSRLFKNGTLSPTVLEHPSHLSDDAHGRLQKSVAEENSGADNAGKPMILEEGMKFSKIDFSAEDLQFLGLRQFQRADIGMFFGVPPFMYGDTEKATSWGTGIAEQNIAFLQYTMIPEGNEWKQSFKRDLLGNDDPTLYLNVDWKFLMQVDIAKRFAAYAVARQWGWYSGNDVRAKEDENPVEGLDTYLEPSNMQDATEPLKRMIDEQNKPSRN